MPTVGFGTTRYPDGRKVQLADAPIDRDTAGAYIAHDLRQDEAALDRLTTVRLHELSRGALVSFTYNCGSGAYRGSTLRKCVNEGAWSDVPRELAKWRIGGGVVLAGLVRRRAAEADLFTRGVRLHNGGPTLDAEPAPIAREPETEARWWQRVFGWWR